MKWNSYFKNILLTLLVALMLFQVFQIWSSSALVSESSGKTDVLREHFIEPVLSWFGKGSSDTFSQNISELMRPRKIVLNQSNQRAVLYDGDESYERVAQLTTELERRLFAGEIPVITRETVSLDDYCAVLKGNSVYMDYGNCYDFRLFSVSVCGQAKNELSGDFSAVRECMLGLDDNVLNHVAFYMKDYKTENIFRYVIDENKTYIDNELKNYFLSEESDPTLSYSFELNFHRQDGREAGPTSSVFDPLILFSLAPTNSGTIVQNRDRLRSWNEMESWQTNEILSMFQINPMTTRKYTNLTNAKVFVENNGTLTISPDGYLEYRAVEGGQGLPLSGAKDGAADIYSAVSAAVDFVFALGEEMPSDTLDSLRFSADLTDSGTQGSYLITFDLYADGLPVLQTEPETGAACHAVVMQIENGNLKYYRQFLRYYRTDEREETLSPVINAIDGLIDQLESPSPYLNVLDISRCYLDGASEDAPEPCWDIQVEGIDSILTVK